MRVPQVSERIKEAPAQALRGVFAGIGQLLLITDKLRNKASHQDVPRARTPGRRHEAPSPTRPSAQSHGRSGRRNRGGAPPRPSADALTGARPAGQAVRGQAAHRPASPPSRPRAASPSPGTTPAAKPGHGQAGTATARRPRAARRPRSPRRPASAAEPPKRQSTRDFDKTGNVRLLGDETADPAAAAAPQPAAGPEPAAAADTAPLPNYDELSVPSLRARLRNLDVTQVRQLAEYERAHAARAEVLTMFERRIAKLEAEA